MRRGFVVAAVVLAALAGCKRERVAEKQPSTAAPSPQAAWFDESSNVLSLMNGAIVYDRTGEIDLSRSAMAIIDSDESTIWATPPDDLDQSIVFELPSLTRIREIRIIDTVTAAVTQFPSTAIDVSDDGKSFTPLLALSRKQPATPLQGSFPPVETRFLRVRTPSSTFGKSQFGIFGEIRAIGESVEPKKVPDISGHWQINDLTGTFAQDGTHFRGVVDMKPQMLIEGTWSGGSARYLWVRGKQFGVGILAANPESTKLNALWWFEAAIPLFFGQAWYGDRVAGTPVTPAAPPAVWTTYLQRFGKAPLYALTFESDGRLSPGSETGVTALARLLQQSPNARLRIKVREIRQADPGVNLALANKEAASIEAALRASGADLSRVSVEATSEGPHNLDMTSNIQRLIYSRVEVELAGEQR